MKVKVLLSFMLLCCGMTYAQNDPTIMTINGQPVSRSEFEYSYNKNNTEGVIDKKSVADYVDLFINYKLKVAAALDAHLDTLSSFKQEFTMYRDQQIKPSMVSDEDMLAEAHKVYDQTKQHIGPQGLIQPEHILLRLSQKASKQEQDLAKLRIDSIYMELKKGANFEEMAKKVSQDPGSARNGGLLSWIGPGNTFKEFEDAAYKLKVGEMSAPVLSPVGYHIILMKARKQLEPFDSLKTNILKFLEARGARDKIVDEKLADIVKKSDGKITKESILDQRADSMEMKDPDLKNLVREYHDGLLLYEISNRMVWDKASKDSVGLEQYFKKNKKNYKWDTPRFKGIAYHVKDVKDIKAVRDCVKDIPFDKWAEKLRTTFNNDSVIRIRVEKGIFKMGDNAYVDKTIFNKDTTVTPMKDYPYDATFGKKLTAPKTFEDVRGQVTADYQDMLEKQWIESLRKKYTVVVNKDVLATVNKH